MTPLSTVLILTITSSVQTVSQDVFFVFPVYACLHMLESVSVFVCKGVQLQLKHET